MGAGAAPAPAGLNKQLPSSPAAAPGAAVGGVPACANSANAGAAATLRNSLLGSKVSPPTDAAAPSADDKAELKPESAPATNPAADAVHAKGILAERLKANEQSRLDKCSENVNDEIRLWEAGWKDRYYADKYKSEDITKGGGREKIYQTYVEGLCWVMLYYYSGCASWKW
jgi:5'-3' exoribonuclease 2